MCVISAAAALNDSLKVTHGCFVLVFSPCVRGETLFCLLDLDLQQEGVVWGFFCGGNEGNESLWEIAKKISEGH